MPSVKSRASRTAGSVSGLRYRSSKPGPYEAAITCEACATSLGSETTFAAGLFRVTGEPAEQGGGGVSTFQVVGILVGLLFVSLLIASIVMWRRGYRLGRSRRRDAGTR